MKINQTISISTSKALLVPYEAHHVLTYHEWMKDPAIQEATASEPMTLEEEYENQESWRTSHDKLTFIVCEPLSGAASDEARQIKAQVDDSPDKMKGDINFFLYLADEDDDDEVAEPRESSTIRLTGEVDVMIANTQHRGKGVGEAAVRSILAYIRRNLPEILNEYAQGEKLDVEKVQLVGLMAKIKQENTGSRALFKKLGFKQEGEANYFGEVKMVIDWKESESEDMAEGLEYRELERYQLHTQYVPTTRRPPANPKPPKFQHHLNLETSKPSIATSKQTPTNSLQTALDTLSIEFAGIFQNEFHRPPRAATPRPAHFRPLATDIHMPLSSPSYIDLNFPPQQLLHALPHSVTDSSNLTGIRSRPRAHGGSILASRPARTAAALRAPKYHERPHEAGAEAETWVAEEDEE
ncbi:acetyltransferase (GNAT) domain-containing protein [Trichoderma breve]|uniref:Acetyltransferase (GNAT) domain-containing protein n=1 Tax=Trichoderma breve TaxID=2034170 RepID=A0A9W9EC43_9HYPO|nr:acetyltransferase (GNAT) domain-containing protein [Trichoderma breve]KAJ4863979.1 acetyltransferase (GNAT) domain-containing protein [Trichoderma breve]